MKKTIDASDRDYYNNLPPYDDPYTVFFLVGLGIAVFFGLLFITANNYHIDLYNNHTCDEIAIIIDGNDGDNYYKGSYYDKCMKSIFPDKYPTQIQLQQYFLDMDCTSLGTHILKRGFEYPQATSIYEIKCSTPLQHLDLPPVIIEQTPDLVIDAHIGQSSRYRD